MRGLIFVAMILGACTAQPQPKYTWTKAGFTLAQYDVNLYGCERDTRQCGSFGGSYVGAVQFYQRCLSAHGYHQIVDHGDPSQQVVVGKTILDGTGRYLGEIN